MRQYSIQSVLDWLDFKGLLKDRSYAEATILCDLNTRSLMVSLKNHIQPISLLVTFITTITIIFTLEHVIPEKYLSLTFIILTISLFLSSLLPQKPLSLSPLLTGSFVAIGLECSYLTLNSILQPIYYHTSLLNIFFHVSLLLIITAHLFTLQRDNNFNLGKGFFVFSFVLSALFGLIHPAILIATLIALTSYKQTNILMVGFGLCLAALFAGWFIYTLDFTWHQKSILMMGVGLVLLLVQSMIRNFDWEDEG